MRRNQQRQLLELLETVRQAQQAGQYADCQQGAIAIGEAIERAEGEGTGTVALLEEYCKELFRVANAETSPKALKKKWIQIRDSIMRELKPNRVEMVFLSYKASMSDCLESIYLAAKADPQCAAVFIPLPFGERVAADGLWKMCYEGPEYYGEEIECTDYREYDIAARRPDVIFTFAPYDGNNYVTRVHPGFYCERLRQLTDSLVFVPYYVGTNSVEKALCTTAGCVFAHKVVLQSQKMRETYLRYYKPIYGNRFGDARDKFVVFGSPKFDKMLRIRREDTELPEQWRTLLQRKGGAKGTEKRVVLYNTSLSMLLRHDGKYLQKLRFVLGTFRARKDALLWWRPHPLMASTLRAMRPALLAEYEELVEEYRREDFGIYDDTPDLHRAIAWSDAYYGDGGSLLALYLATGKPAMVQDMEAGGRMIPNLRFIRFSEDRETLWYSDMNTSALMRIRKESWAVEWVCHLTQANSKGYSMLPNQYGRPVLHSGAIYCTPRLAGSISKMDVETGEVTHIAFPHAKCDDKAVKFYNAISWGKYIFFTPRSFPAVMRLDTHTNEVSLHAEWLEPLLEQIGVGNVQAPLFVQPAVAGTSIWLLDSRVNTVIEFDMQTCAQHLYTVGRAAFRYSGICFDGDSFWLSPQGDTPLVKWNPQRGECEKLSLPCEQDKEAANPFCPPVFCGGFVWLLPREARHALKIDVQAGVVSIAEEFEADCREMEDWPGWKYGWAQALGESIYAYNAKDRALVEYNWKMRVFRKETLVYPSEALACFDDMAVKSFLREADSLKKQADGIYNESQNARLDDYLRYLALYGDSCEEKAMADRRAEVFRRENANMDGTAGQKIYEEMKRLAWR